MNLANWPESAVHYFLARFVIGDPDECWPWLGQLTEKGYGRFRHTSQELRAHRKSYEYHNGPFDETLDVCHACDNPCCVNPSHLFLGTNDQDRQDSVAKTRHAFGERHGMALLMIDQVLAIRAATGCYRTIGELYGVTPQTVCDIKKGRSWKHL